jgi:hypothetical protein
VSTATGTCSEPVKDLGAFQELCAFSNNVRTQLKNTQTKTNARAHTHTQKHTYTHTHSHTQTYTHTHSHLIQLLHAKPHGVRFNSSCHFGKRVFISDKTYFLGCAIPQKRRGSIGTTDTVGALPQ